ncbi:hypothetical protein INS49_003512 [Diaporthe citri]|uniref:uncharacterized protein n=1 Tax=Diaporthe citri TaxID=83186 RepID=UPI001C7FBB13|nr:uncharacterized protein INS49_003512 [Diaporthe citri]KAG6355550.1 hypothetical protein INS49_003512 [Diaporthe citri]
MHARKTTEGRGRSDSRVDDDQKLGPFEWGEVEMTQTTYQLLAGQGMTEEGASQVAVCRGTGHLLKARLNARHAIAGGLASSQVEPWETRPRSVIS